MRQVMYVDEGLKLEIHSFETLPSTQLYLEEAIREGRLKAPVAVIAERQTEGIGSRGNEWIGEEGNLFFSFALFEDDLPQDLPLSSASIYFGFLMKETLEALGASVWLKWPNDLYSQEKKVGGVLTKKLEKVIICGIGINTVSAPLHYGILDFGIPNLRAFQAYMENLKKGIGWKEIFRKFSVEFEFNKQKKIPNPHGVNFQKATLLEDGSLEIDGTKVYSLR